MTGNDHSCGTWEWPWRRLDVRQCPDCGAWWKAQPVSLTRSGGWRPANRLEVWWARRRNRLVTDAGNTR